MENWILDGEMNYFSHLIQLMVNKIISQTSDSIMKSIMNSLWLIQNVKLVAHRAFGTP